MSKLSREQIVGNALNHMVAQRKLLDRLLTCVPGPDSDGYKLAKILKIAEEWQNIR